MKTVFVNRFFHPDHSATSQILSELAFELAAAGRPIHVVTSRQRYDDADARLATEETIFGVHVHRVRTTRFGRANLAGRAIDYVSFYVMAFFRLLTEVDRGDIVVSKTDPPLLSVVVALVAKVRGAVLVNWLQDLFPEVAQRLGVKAIRGPVGGIVTSARNWSLRFATANVVLGDHMAEFVNRFASGVRVIHNWAIGDAIRPIRIEESELRREWGLGDRFVIAYSGNLGRAHEFRTILGAIDTLRNDNDVLFLFIGGGKQMDSLRAGIEDRKLSERVMFRPYQPKEHLSRSLGAANAHLVTLQPALEGLIVPSKFYGIAAAGRATLFIGDPDGEIPRILRRYDCGYSIATGDGATLVRRICDLRADPETCERLGANARRAIDEHFDRSIAVAKWKALLDEVGTSANRSP